MSELIRTGTVSSVNNANKTVRVYFPELDEEVSDTLRIVDTGAPMPSEMDEVLCIFLPDSPETGFVLKLMR